MGSRFDSSLDMSGSRTDSRWAGFLVGGVMMIVFSIIAFSISASLYDTEVTSPFYETKRESGRMFAIFGTFFLIIGLISIPLSFKVRRNEQAKLERMTRMAEESHAQHIQEIAKVVKSTIKVRCRYCETLNDENDSNCESCGAPL